MPRGGVDDKRRRMRCLDTGLEPVLTTSKVVNKDEIRRHRAEAGAPSNIKEDHLSHEPRDGEPTIHPVGTWGARQRQEPQAALIEVSQCIRQVAVGDTLLSNNCDRHAGT